jgi:hypothetical protein
MILETARPRAVVSGVIAARVTLSGLRAGRLQVRQIEQPFGASSAL